MIYTSYYAKVKELGDCIKIQISNSAPKIEGLHKLPILIPNWESIVKPKKSGAITEDEYKKRYIKQLDNNEDVIVSLFTTLKDSPLDVVLLCYEKMGDFCHRHILAEWLNNKFGYELVKEYIE